MSSLVFAGAVTAITVVTGTHGLPRTEITLDDGGQTIDFALPGANGGPPVAVWGVPRVEVGQRWQVSLVRPHGRWIPSGLGAGMELLDGAAPPWVLNGLHYQPEQLPLVFAMNERGSDDLGVAASEAAILDALGDWTNVGCSTFAFDYAGRVDAGADDDEQNVLGWEEDTWEWGETIAGLTMTRFGPVGDGVGPVGADILFNAVDWTWTEGEGDVLANPPLLNIHSVLSHELGHVTGMDHDMTRVTSTMFYAYIGGDWMGTLSGDDRRGLCENYPAGVGECDSDEDCAGIDASTRRCVSIDDVFVCDEERDPIGADCSRTHINCEEYCVFTNLTATEGYCTLPCAEEACPTGYTCGADDRAFPADGAPICVPADPDPDEPTDTAVDDTAVDDTGAATDTAGCGCASGGRQGAFAALGGFVAMVLSRRRRR
ncbi:MAG: matrixin family metalloprotease [Pseudomonadota bacterium]|nr:matrixin family metalloprotease [Pseudomonadota bacterium]